MKNSKEAKTDAALPAYCNPPNPCPVGYAAEDGCLEQFENTAGFSRQFQASQDCMCDSEHMFDCPASAGRDLHSSGTGNDLIDTDLDRIMEQIQVITLSSASILSCPWYQNFAVYYSAVYYSAVYYSAVYYSAVYYSAVYYSAVYYSAVYYSAVYYSAVYYSAVYYSAVYYSAVHYSAVNYSAVHYNAVYYSAVHYSAVNYSAVHYNAVYYSVVYYSVLQTGIASSM